MPVNRPLQHALRRVKNLEERLVGVTALLEGKDKECKNLAAALQTSRELCDGLRADKRKWEEEAAGVRAILNGTQHKLDKITPERDDLRKALERALGFIEGVKGAAMPGGEVQRFDFPGAPIHSDRFTNLNGEPRR